MPVEQNQGPSMAELNASGALGNSNVQSGNAVGQSQPSQPGILPFGDKEMPSIGGDIEGTIKTGSIDAGFQTINAGGGAFGNDIVTAAAGAVNHLGVVEAKGDDLRFEQTHTNNITAPTVQGDLQMKSVGIIGGEGQQH